MDAMIYGPDSSHHNQENLELFDLGNNPAWILLDDGEAGGGSGHSVCHPSLPGVVSAYLVFTSSPLPSLPSPRHHNYQDLHCLSHLLARPPGSVLQYYHDQEELITRNSRTNQRLRDVT